MTTIALHMISESSDHYTFAVDLDLFETLKGAVDYVKERCFEFDCISGVFSDYTKSSAKDEQEHEEFMGLLKECLKQAWYEAEEEYESNHV